MSVGQDGRDRGLGRRTIRTGYASATGRVREHNEDSCHVGEQLVAVADGMGGHAAGEVASRLAVEAMSELDRKGALTVDHLHRQVRQAAERITTSAAQDPARRGMGTTLALAARTDDDGWTVLHVGDSRVYRLTEAGLERLTRDHSEVEELIAAGLLTEAEARTHPRRNVITRSLGAQGESRPDFAAVALRPGELLLLCTDGLTNELEDDEIEVLLRRHEDPQEAADALVAAAVDAGGRDNVTVVVVRRPAR